MIWIILIAFIFILGIDSHVISLVRNLDKIFVKKSLFSSSSKLIALDSISLRFQPQQINTIIGSSGSGKSTLAKCLIGMEPISSGEIVFADAVCPVFSYMDALFYMSYNDNDDAKHILDVEADKLIHRIPASDTSDFARRIMLLLGTNEFITLKPRDMLTTQRKSFEMILALLRCKSCVSSTSSSMNPSIHPILVLDEYLDKELMPIHIKLKPFLEMLITMLKLQIFIITHSKTVWLNYSDHTVVMHRGRVYDEGKADTVSLPSSLQFIQ